MKKMGNSLANWGVKMKQPHLTIHRVDHLGAMKSRSRSGNKATRLQKPHFKSSALKANGFLYP